VANGWRGVLQTFVILRTGFNIIVINKDIPNLVTNLIYIVPSPPPLPPPFFFYPPLPFDGGGVGCRGASNIRTIFVLIFFVFKSQGRRCAARAAVPFWAPHRGTHGTIHVGLNNCSQ